MVGGRVRGADAEVLRGQQRQHPGTHLRRASRVSDSWDNNVYGVEKYFVVWHGEHMHAHTFLRYITRIISVLQELARRYVLLVPSCITCNVVTEYGLPCCATAAGLADSGVGRVLGSLRPVWAHGHIEFVPHVSHVLRTQQVLGCCQVGQRCVSLVPSRAPS